MFLSHDQLYFLFSIIAKAAGFVVLLGVGGVLCYHWLYSLHRKFIAGGIRTSLFPMSFEMEQDGGDDCQEMEEVRTRSVE